VIKPGDDHEPVAVEGSAMMSERTWWIGSTIARDEAIRLDVQSAKGKVPHDNGRYSMYKGPISQNVVLTKLTDPFIKTCRP